jgi:hypothetical protein
MYSLPTFIIHADFPQASRLRFPEIKPILTGKKCIPNGPLVFFSFFRKILSNMPLTERFQEMDLRLAVIHAGAKVTQLGVVGAKPPCHLADDAELALTWQHLDDVTIGAKSGATDLLSCISFFILSISRLF